MKGIPFSLNLIGTSEANLSVTPISTLYFTSQSSIRVCNLDSLRIKLNSRDTLPLLIDV